MPVAGWASGLLAEFLTVTHGFRNEHGSLFLIGYNNRGTAAVRSIIHRSEGRKG